VEERNYVGACAKRAFPQHVVDTHVLQMGLLQGTTVTLASVAGV